MENDQRSENEENLIDINEYFKLDFPAQKLKGNRQFEEYKIEKINQLGRDAKLFHCNIDHIYFYVSKAQCKILPYYLKECPLCKNYICYFCERNFTAAEHKGNCCPKLNLY